MLPAIQRQKIDNQSKIIVQVKSKIFPGLVHWCEIDLKCYEKIDWSAFDIDLQCHEIINWNEIEQQNGPNNGPATQTERDRRHTNEAD